MVNMFTISKKGGNNGKLWNSNQPQQFFTFLHGQGVRRIWDIRRSPNGQYDNFFCMNILKWCCEHDGLKYEWRVDFAPQKEVFTACNNENWDLFKYAQAYFTPQIIAALNTIKTAEELDGVALLCAEQELFNCHRLLIAEYFKAKFTDNITVRHLGLAYDRYGREKGEVPTTIMYNTRLYIKQLLEN